MKILRISTGIFSVPPVAGGAVERFIYDLSNSLAREGIEEHLIANLGENAYFDRRIVPHQIGRAKLSFTAGFYGWILNFVIGSLLVSRAAIESLLIHRDRYDIIHGHDLLSTLLLLAIRKILGSKAFSTPIVFTIHGSTQRSAPYRGFKEFVCCVGNALNRLVWKNADHLIALGSVPRKELVEDWRIPENRISVVTPGVDTDFFRPSTELAAHITRRHWIRDRYCLFVGRLSPAKGPQFLLSALRDIDIRCILVGDGQYRRELQEMARNLGISKRVEFRGLLPFSEIRPVYAGADLFVLPTLKEGSPLVILEAMASGLPIISSKVSGVVDAVVDGYNGFTVVPGDIIGLREKILTLTTDVTLRRVMGARSRRLATEQFDWHKIAVKTISVYKEVLEGVRMKRRSLKVQT